MPQRLRALVETCPGSISNTHTVAHIIHNSSCRRSSTPLISLHTKHTHHICKQNTHTHETILYKKKYLKTKHILKDTEILLCCPSWPWAQGKQPSCFSIPGTGTLHMQYHSLYQQILNSGPLSCFSGFALRKERVFPCMEQRRPPLPLHSFTLLRIRRNLSPRSICFTQQGRHLLATAGS